jgi:hypothetical protein
MTVAARRPGLFGLVVLATAMAAVPTVGQMADQHEDRDKNEEAIVLQELAHPKPFLVRGEDTSGSGRRLALNPPEALSAYPFG